MAEETVGFVGLGVMGEPICRNIRARTGRPVTAFDTRREPLERLAGSGVRAARGLAEVARADIILLSLPGGPEVEAVVLGEDGLIRHLRTGQVVVDLSTSPVALARRIGRRLDELDVDFADAPVARTRQAAIDGTLSIMVGGEPATFERIRSGARGRGERDHPLRPDRQRSGRQADEQHGAVSDRDRPCRGAVHRAGGRGRRAPAVRDPGQGLGRQLRAQEPRREGDAAGEFPKNAFATDYAIKDIGYALELAAEAGIDAPGAALAGRLLARSSELGHGKRYFPALLELYRRSTR